jgi:hypothetical protein
VKDLTQLYSHTKGNLDTYFNSMEDVRKNLQKLNTKIIKCERLVSTKVPLLVSMGKVPPELWEEYVSKQLTANKVVNQGSKRPHTSVKTTNKKDD